MNPYQQANRAQKVRVLASAFKQGNFTRQQVRQLEPSHWEMLTKQLKDAGVLKPNATVPSKETIDQVVRMLRRRCNHRRAI